MKTILEIAKAADVPKLKVWRYIKKHNIETFHEMGMIQLDETVANEVISILSKKTNRIIETVETLRETFHETVFETLREQLKVKDEQLKIKDEQLANLSKLLDQEQQLHLKTKTELNSKILLLEESTQKKKWWWQK
jgi:hypothetical protein